MRQSARCGLLLVGVLCGAAVARAQFDLDHSVTDASLRGVSAAGPGIAWASGSGGTILRTEDGGYLWQRCTPPKGAESLDFRGVQGFDAMTALVMASGKGEASRVYKTTDGCSSWRQVLTNADAPEGFFDAMVFVDRRHGILLGDPVPGAEGKAEFRLSVTSDGGETWTRVRDSDGTLVALHGEAAFAASNSALAVKDGWLWFGTSGGRVLRKQLDSGAKGVDGFSREACGGQTKAGSGCAIAWTGFAGVEVPMVRGESAGVFSVQFRDARVGVAVGGDYAKPGSSEGTAAYSDDGGVSWHAATHGPSGYRSAVAYDDASRAWIAVGPSGADVSYDDGKTWKPLQGAGGWNAISLPYAVGAKGKIGHLWAGGLAQGR